MGLPGGCLVRLVHHQSVLGSHFVIKSVHVGHFDAHGLRTLLVDHVL